VRTRESLPAWGGISTFPAAHREKMGRLGQSAQDLSERNALSWHPPGTQDLLASRWRTRAGGKVLGPGPLLLVWGLVLSEGKPPCQPAGNADRVPMEVDSSLEKARRPAVKRKCPTGGV